VVAVRRQHHPPPPAPPPAEEGSHFRGSQGSQQFDSGSIIYVQLQTSFASLKMTTTGILFGWSPRVRNFFTRTNILDSDGLNRHQNRNRGG